MLGVPHGTRDGRLTSLVQRVHPRGGILFRWKGVVIGFVEGGLEGEESLPIVLGRRKVGNGESVKTRYGEGRKVRDGSEGSGGSLGFGGVGGGVAVEEVTDGDEVSVSPGWDEGGE